LENELADKEDRFRAAVSTRQEFAGQLVAAQQRELAVMAENAKLIETRVSINHGKLIDINYDRSSDGMTVIIYLQERLLNDLDAERTKTCRLEEIIERTNVESAADNEKHFKQGFYVAKNLVSMKEEGALEL